MNSNEIMYALMHHTIYMHIYIYFQCRAIVICGFSPGHVHTIYTCTSIYATPLLFMRCVMIIRVLSQAIIGVLTIHTNRHTFVHELALPANEASSLPHYYCNILLFIQIMWHRRFSSTFGYTFLERNIELYFYCCAAE